MLVITHQTTDHYNKYVVAFSSGKMEYCGDRYEGETHNERMEGYGKYTLSTGAYYEGEMYDGMYHGEGTLHFPNGSKYHAVWENGQAKNGEIIFSDGFRYREEAHYADEFDRRFYTEICSGIRPTGRSQIVDKEPEKQIPDGCYDTGDGFYNPLTKVVVDYNGRFLRNAGAYVDYLQVQKSMG
ncbi:MORN repeat-containing protein [Schistosoma japonicum]|uniref:MORN repeat-containing protein 5 n=1 Tax=Schistosoma japonicum TaxID=6182 RepID=A0A4Z2DNK6_SCHJA|nr:MORN repeat-containing protein [Schistosoma japonicum]